MSTLEARMAVVTEIYGQRPPMRRMTEREFDAWIEEKTRAEWVDGEVVMMAPAAVDHDDVVGWLIAMLKLLLALRPTGSVHGPEVLVRLSEDPPKAPARRRVRIVRAAVDRGEDGDRRPARHDH